MIYLTISYTVTHPNKSIAPTKFTSVLYRTPNYEKFYRPEGGPTYFYLPKGEYSIAKNHGELDLNDDDDFKVIEDLVIRNYKDHHQPVCELRESAGWLSPDGNYYPCRPWEHDYQAEVICRAVLCVLMGTQHLESLGWFRVYDHGMVVRINTPTQGQLDALWDLHQLAANPDFKRQIGYSIKREV